MADQRPCLSAANSIIKKYASAGSLDPGCGKAICDITRMIEKVVYDYKMKLIDIKGRIAVADDRGEIIADINCFLDNLSTQQTK